MVGTESTSTGYDTHAGSVTITVRTENRIAGTFYFEANVNIFRMYPRHYSVTNGTFDVTADNGLPALPTGTPSGSAAH